LYGGFSCQAWCEGGFLQYCQCTPELQWQSRGEMAYLTGGGNNVPGRPCIYIWGVQCIYTAYLTGRGGAVRRQGGHAFVYLRLDMPAAHVDVNVHPTKREVTPSSETGSPLNCHCDSGVNSRYSRGAPYQNARWAMYHYQRLQYCLCTPELQRQPRGECL